MEEYRCAYENCLQLGEYKGNTEYLLCLGHLQEILRQENEFEWHKKYHRKTVVHGEQKQNINLLASTAFGTSCLLWIASEALQIPLDTLNTLEKLSDTFVKSIFEIGNGNSELLKKYCNHYFYTLTHFVFNLKVDTLELFCAVEKVYNEYHCEKQTLISSLISAELDNLENRLSMPKSASKFLSTVELDVVKQEFISVYFLKDKIDFNEFYKAFCSRFEPFMSDKPNRNVFDTLESVFSTDLDRLIYKTKNEFLQIANKIWSKENFQATSVYLHPVPNQGEILNLSSGPIKLSSFFLTNTEVHLESVTSLSSSSLALVLTLEEDSYLAYYSDNKTHLIKHFPQTKIICAEGSDENFILIYEVDKRKCEIYRFEDSNIEANEEFDLKLEENEVVDDLVFIQSTKSKVIFSTNKRGISIVYKNTHRVFVNLQEDLSECNWQLKYYRTKEVILLKSSKKIRVFSEFLEKMGEFAFECDHFTYKVCQERALILLLRQYNEYNEYLLDTKLNYTEPWQGKQQSLPSNCSHYAIKPLNASILKNVGKEYHTLISKEFLIRN